MLRLQLRPTSKLFSSPQSHPFSAMTQIPPAAPGDKSLQVAGQCLSYEFSCCASHVYDVRIWSSSFFSLEKGTAHSRGYVKPLGLNVVFPLTCVSRTRSMFPNHFISHLFMPGVGKKHYKEGLADK